MRIHCQKWILDPTYSLKNGEKWEFPSNSEIGPKTKRNWLYRWRNTTSESIREFHLFKYVILHGGLAATCYISYTFVYTETFSLSISGSSSIDGTSATCALQTILKLYLSTHLHMFLKSNFTVAFLSVLIFTENAGLWCAYWNKHISVAAVTMLGFFAMFQLHSSLCSNTQAKYGKRSISDGILFIFISCGCSQVWSFFAPLYSLKECPSYESSHF